MTIFRLPKHFQDVFKMSQTSSRLLKMFSKCLQDVFKTSWKAKNYTSWKTRNCYAQDVFKASSRYVLKTSSRCLEDHQMFAWLILFMNFLSLETVPYPYKSAIQTKHYQISWTGFRNNLYCFGPAIVDIPEALAVCPDVASLSHVTVTILENGSLNLNQLLFQYFLSLLYQVCCQASHFVVSIHWYCQRSTQLLFSTYSYLTNPLPSDCCPLTYKLNPFKGNGNKHLF